MTTTPTITSTLQRVIEVAPNEFAAKVAKTIIEKGYYSYKQAEIINEFIYSNNDDVTFSFDDVLSLTDMHHDDMHRASVMRQLPSSMR